MQRVTMDDMPMESEDTVKYVERNDGIRAVYKGLEYLPCDGGYMLVCPEIYEKGGMAQL